MAFFYQGLKLREVIAIIGKQPLEGFSKTRLASDVGEDQAFEFSQALLRDTLSQIHKERPQLPVKLFYAPGNAQAQTYFREILEEVGFSSFTLHPQVEAPFFERLQNIFRVIHSLLGETWIHLTGTDIPDIPASLWKKGERGEVHIGPDQDGGYYYLGSSSAQHQIFDFGDHIPGSEEVLKATEKLIKNQNLAIKKHRVWSDIDTLEDLIAFQKRTQNDLSFLTNVLCRKVFRDI